MAGPIEAWRDVAASAETAAEMSRRLGAAHPDDPELYLAEVNVSPADGYGVCPVRLGYARLPKSPGRFVRGDRLGLAILKAMGLGHLKARRVELVCDVREAVLVRVEHLAEEGDADGVEREVTDFAAAGEGFSKFSPKQTRWVDDTWTDGPADPSPEGAGDAGGPEWGAALATRPWWREGLSVAAMAATAALVAAAVNAAALLLLRAVAR